MRVLALFFSSQPHYLQKQRLHSTRPPPLVSATHWPSTRSASPFFSGLLEAFCSRDTFQTCLATIQCLALCITPLVSKSSFIVSNHPSASWFLPGPLAASWLICGSPDWLYVLCLDNATHLVSWLWSLNQITLHIEVWVTYFYIHLPHQASHLCVLETWWYPYIHEFIVPPYVLSISHLLICVWNMDTNFISSYLTGYWISPQIHQLNALSTTSISSSPSPQPLPVFTWSLIYSLINTGMDAPDWSSWQSLISPN